MTAGVAVLAIGGCHRDIVGRTSAPFERGTSCPGRLRETAGGVARNVAVLMAGMGPVLSVALATRVGADAAADGLVAGLRDAGVDDSHVVRDLDAATGTYVALHGPDGDLVAALSDLRIYDAMTPDRLAGVEPAVSEASVVFADANLPAESLDRIAMLAGRRLAVDAISRAKAARVVGAGRAGALVFLNRIAAGALLDPAPADAAEAAAGLLRLGFSRVVVTDGGRPLALLDGGVIETIAVPAVPVADVTGAGDALVAGTLATIALGADLRGALRIGIRAAGAALAVTGALPALPPDVAAAALAAAAENWKR